MKVRFKLGSRLGGSFQLLQLRFVNDRWLAANLKGRTQLLLNELGVIVSVNRSSVH